MLVLAIGCIGFASENTVEVRVGVDLTSKTKLESDDFDDTSITLLKKGFELGTEYRRKLGDSGFEIGGGLFYKHNSYKELIDDVALVDGLGVDTTTKKINAWNKYFSELNIFGDPEDKEQVLVYTSLETDINKNYIYGVKIENGNLIPLETKYQHDKGIRNHERLVHPLDYIKFSEEGEFKHIDFEKSKSIQDQSTNAVYISDKYQEIYDENGRKFYALQPFTVKEINTTIFEELTNEKYNTDGKNSRFLYMRDLIKAVKIFETKEELEKFFDVGR